MIEALEAAARKLQTRRQLLSDEVLRTPPQSYDKFMLVVGEYKGLSEAVILINDILHGNEDI